MYWNTSLAEIVHTHLDRLLDYEPPTCLRTTRLDRDYCLLFFHTPSSKAQDCLWERYPNRRLNSTSHTIAKPHLSIFLSCTYHIMCLGQDGTRHTKYTFPLHMQGLRPWGDKWICICKTRKTRTLHLDSKERHVAWEVDVTTPTLVRLQTNLFSSLVTYVYVQDFSMHHAIEITPTSRMHKILINKTSHKEHKLIRFLQ